MVSEPCAITSVESLDLNHYRGLWYEIGRRPFKCEDADTSDITAENTLEDDGSIRVENRSLNRDGVASRSIGRATPVNGQAGRLQVSFLPQFLRWIRSRKATTGS